MNENKEKSNRPSLGEKLADFTISLSCNEYDYVSCLEQNKRYRGIIQRLFSGENSNGIFME